MEETAPQVVAEAPWTLVEDSRVGDEHTRRWTHPAGAVLLARTTTLGGASLRVRLSAPPDREVEVPTPVWVPGGPAPVQAWLAGAEGRVLERGADGLVWWTQQAGQCRLVDAGIGLWDDPCRVPAGATLVSQWQSRRVESVGQAVAGLPAWLPEELVGVVGDEVVVDLPDAGLVLDGRDLSTTRLRLGRGWSHLDVHHCRGLTRLDLAGAPGLDEVASWRAREALDTDPRRWSGALAWIVARASRHGAGAGIPAAVRDAVETLMSRPGADLSTCAVAALCAAQDRDLDLWESAVAAAGNLPAAQPGAVMVRVWMRGLGAVATTGAPWPQPPALPPLEGTPDPLVLAERAVWSGAGGLDADLLAAGLEAVWLLGADLPAPDPGPLVDDGGRVSPWRTAMACAVTSPWPASAALTEGRTVSVGQLRQRARRRLLALDHLDDEALALLLW